MDAFIQPFGLLFLSVGAGYANKLYSCDTQRFLTNNVYAKHGMAFVLLMLFIISSKVNFVSKVEDGDWKTPELLMNAFILYLMFVIAGKMEFFYTASIITGLVGYLLLSNEESNKSEETKNTIAKYKKYIMYGIAACAVVGVATYYTKQQRDHQDFSLRKFIFGVKKCKDTSQPFDIST